MADRQRLQRAVTAMARHGLDLLAVPPGDDLLYLMGFSPLSDERPCYLFLTPETSLFVVPDVNAAQTQRHTHDPLLTYSDADGPAKVLAAARQRLGPKRRIGAGDTMRADALLLLQQQWQDTEVVPASVVLAPLRMRKSAQEIDALRRAAATADAAVRAGVQACRPGVSEGEIAAAAEAGFRAAGAPEVRLTIVASGPNSAFPHHHTCSRRVQSGEPILFDLGNRVDGYCSDITRMAYLGVPSARYQEIHAIVDAAVRAALGVIRPGVPVKDVDAAARTVIERAGYGQYFVHRTGHGIGLSDHEPPSITATNTLLLLEEMAFSVEPGIYLPGEFGVRLEEIVVVTARGADVLSKLPRDVNAIS